LKEQLPLAAQLGFLAWVVGVFVVGYLVSGPWPGVGPAMSRGGQETSALGPAVTLIVAMAPLIAVAAVRSGR